MRPCPTTRPARSSHMWSSSTGQTGSCRPATTSAARAGPATWPAESARRDGVTMTRAGGPRLAIVGSGSLARSLCYGLGSHGGQPLDVSVIARSARAVHDVAHVAGVRAGLSGAPVSFRAVAAQLTEERLAELFGQIQPDAVVLCASTQSPWER